MGIIGTSNRRLGPWDSLRDLLDAITELGDETLIKCTYFETINSGTSGTVSAPVTGATFVLNEWSAGVDALISTIDTGKPTYISARSAGGTVITTTFDASGNYVLSDTPSAYPVALIYVYTCSLANYDSSKVLFETELIPEHGDLYGLGDDDHTQYILVDGTRDFTGFPDTPASAPTTDYQIANKKYIDDAISGLTTDHGSLTGLGDDDHTQYILHSLATAANDFLVASGSGTFVKKTLAETGAILEADIDHGNIQGLTDDDHTQYVRHNLSTAANDMLFGSGSNTWVKKTLAEAGAILEGDIDHGNLQGLSDNDHSQYILHSLADAANDFLVASGADTFVKKTLAETGAILEADLDHGNIQGLGDDDHTIYILADGTRDFTGFPDTPASAPTTDYQIANKKYVDDNAGSGGDPHAQEKDTIQDWLDNSRYLNATVLPFEDGTTLIDNGVTDMDFDATNFQFDFTVGEIMQTDSLENGAGGTIEECICYFQYTDSGTPTLQVSADGGSNWETITDQTAVVTFTNTGSDLRLKFTAGGTGTLDFVGVLFNPQTGYSEATPLAWLSKSAAFTANSGRKYTVDTSSAALTATLPVSPSYGDEIRIVDEQLNFAVNNCILSRNGNNIEGLASDYTLNSDGEDVRLLYIDATIGWRVLSV